MIFHFRVIVGQCIVVSSRHMYKYKISAIISTALFLSPFRVSMPTCFVELLGHHLADAMPLLQDLDEARQGLVICCVQQFTGWQGWETVNELVHQRWVVYRASKVINTLCKSCIAHSFICVIWKYAQV